jgi:cohesin loading factor subunit SCC2
VGIKAHLQDNSAAVREAAVELIGKYMIDTPGVVGEYYHMIAARIQDLGLGVRKRVIKLLRAFYAVADASDRVDICTKLVMRLHDEDDGVKDLALRTLEELWFAQVAPGPRKALPDSQAELHAKVATVMGVATHFRERGSPVEDMLHRIAAGKTGPEAEEVSRQYAEVCGALIDGLVDATNIPGFVSLPARFTRSRG